MSLSNESVEPVKSYLSEMPPYKKMTNSRTYLRFSHVTDSKSKILAILFSRSNIVVELINVVAILFSKYT